MDSLQAELIRITKIMMEFSHVKTIDAKTILTVINIMAQAQNEKYTSFINDLTLRFTAITTTKEKIRGLVGVRKKMVGLFGQSLKSTQYRYSRNSVIVWYIITNEMADRFLLLFYDKH